MDNTELVELVKNLQKQVDAISERLAAIEEAIDPELILADKELSPEVAEENAQLAAEEVAEMERLKDY